MLQNFADLNDAEPFTADDLRDRLTALSDGGILIISLVGIVLTMHLWTEILALLIRKDFTSPLL